MSTAGSPQPPLRDRYIAFIERHEVAWELVVAAFTIAWVTVSLAFEEQADEPALLAFDLVVFVILAAEFVSRFAATRDHRAYLRGHWIDAISLIPVARAFRLLRRAAAVSDMSMNRNALGR